MKFYLNTEFDSYKMLEDSLNHYFDFIVGGNVENNDEEYGKVISDIRVVLIEELKKANSESKFVL